MIKTLCIATLLGAVAGCTLPTTQVSSGSTRPTLRLTGAPQNSELFLDGKPAGAASQFDGVHGALAIEEGPHLVAVRQGDAWLVQKRIFAAAGEAVSVDVLTPSQP